MIEDVVMHIIISIINIIIITGSSYFCPKSIAFCHAVNIFTVATKILNNIIVVIDLVVITITQVVLIAI